MDLQVNERGEKVSRHKNVFIKTGANYVKASETFFLFVLALDFNAVNELK